MRLRIHILFLLMALWSLSVGAQTLGTQENVLHKVEDCDPEKVKVIILTDIQELEKREWHGDFARLVSNYPKEMIESNKIYQDPSEWGEWEDVLNESVDKLTWASGYPRPYELMIVKDPMINAFAVEGGYIFVNVGLLAMVDNLDQLRMVLAHEMAHIHQHHNYQNYVKSRKAQNAAAVGQGVGILVGGLAGAAIQIASQVVAYDVVMAHSRSQETEADELGAASMEQSEYSVSDGVEFMQMLYRMSEKYEITTGHSTSGFYGGTHPDSKLRYDKLRDAYPRRVVDETYGSKNFLKLRAQAREEMLRLLNEQNEFRTTIETGWHFLLKDMENMEIRQHMFDALNGLKEKNEVNFITGHVLINKYHGDAELLKALREADVSSEEAKEYIRNILLMIDGQGNTPFPLNITFQELYRWLEADLAGPANVEALLHRATRNGIDKEMLEEYLAQGGKYPNYAAYLLNPDTFYFHYTTVLPLRLEAFDAYQYKLEYGWCFNHYDWSKILSTIKEEHDDVVFMNLLDSFAIPTEEASALLLLSSMSGYSYQSMNKEIDLLEIDPALAEFLLRENVGTLITMDYFEERGRARLQYQTFELRENPPRMRRVFEYMSTSGNTKSPDFMSKKFKKVLKKYYKAF